VITVNEEDLEQIFADVTFLGTSKEKMKREVVRTAVINIQL
jgi:hypothetical protein